MVARGEQIELACQRGSSLRRACGLFGVSRSALGYELRLPVKDKPVIAAMKTLSALYPRNQIFVRRRASS